MTTQSLARPPFAFLLTRPAPASARFAAALRDSFGPDARIVVSPLMQPVFLHPPLPSGAFDALILTSETGAEAARRLSAERGGLPVAAYCVGDRTAAAATAAGFRATSAQGNAKALTRIIRIMEPKGRFLHLRGRDTVGDIVQQLDLDGIMARDAVVYEQVPQPPSSDALAVLQGSHPVVLPLFSPRSADLVAAIGPVRAPLWVAALSEAVAERARGLSPARLVIADRPDATAMLQAVESLCAAGGRT